MRAGLFNIVCPHCKRETLENTEKFNPAVIPDGTMFREIKGARIRSRHVASRRTKGQNFPCPQCFMPLVEHSKDYLTLRSTKSGDTVLSCNVVEGPPQVIEKPAKKAAPKKKKKPVKRNLKKK